MAIECPVRATALDSRIGETPSVAGLSLLGFIAVFGPPKAGRGNQVMSSGEVVLFVCVKPTASFFFGMPRAQGLQIRSVGRMIVKLASKIQSNAPTKTKP